MKTREPLGVGSAPLAGARLEGEPGEQAAWREGWMEGECRPLPFWEIAGSIFLSWDLSCRAGTPICSAGQGVASHRPHQQLMQMAAVRSPSAALWTPQMVMSALQSAAPSASASGMHARVVTAQQRHWRWGTVHILPRVQNDCTFGMSTKADAQAHQHEPGSTVRFLLTAPAVSLWHGH